MKTRQRLAVPLLGLLLGAGAAVGASTPTHAASIFDGTWTVSHGGDGQLTLNSDGTYTSTCEVRDGYGGAQCPDPSGTFARGSGGSSTYVNFFGDAGHTVSYRWAGPVSEPTSMAIGGLNGMIIDRGNDFVCSEFFENGYQLARTPMVYVGDNGNIFGVGSDQDLGPRNADNWLFLAEVAPNYFVEGHCDDVGGNPGDPGTDAVHVGDITVTNVTVGGATYNRGTNTDPDGDSTGTVLTVVQP